MIHQSIGLLTTKHIRANGKEADQFFVVLCAVSRIFQRIIDVRIVKE